MTRSGQAATTPSGGKLTPMFRQWQQAKRQHPDALLFFRMGDFYELFFDDARTAAPILGIALTSRGKGTATSAPMCGVPHHAARNYIARLVKAGHRVAVCEQMEDPKKAKGMVRREVVRVVSPGTLVDADQLDPGSGNYLACLAGQAPGPWGLCLVDLSTGGMVLARAGNEPALAEVLSRYEVRELLVASTSAATLEALLGRHGLGEVLLTTLDDSLFEPLLARDRVVEQLQVASLAGFGCEDDHPALPATAAALAHLQRTQRVQPAHLDRLRVEDPRRILLLDRSSRRNLEVVANLRDGGRSQTLLEALDATLTPLGARALRTWLLEPLVEKNAILARHAVVEALVQRAEVRASLREALREIRDLERLLSRAALRRSTPHDLAALRRSLAALPEVREALAGLTAPDATALAARIDLLEDLLGELGAGLADEPGAAPGEGRVIREGYDADLDAVRELARGSRELIAGIETREREATGIASLKIKYNKVFGYFLEVSKANLSRVPPEWERRQTIATGERYVTAEIKDLEARILSASERLAEREKALFEKLVDQVVAQAGRVRETAAAIAEADVLAGFAEVAAREGYVRPSLAEDDRIEIRDGRHPVVERLLEPGRFVPNDCLLDDKRRLLIVTGPNMGGKSTYLRQAALIVLMAQAGAFVPARSARISLVDRIFCRVGASDNLAGGESTFMVEMTETANILHNATPRSLVILDEIGRGTATWDGMAIAWAVVEHLLRDTRLRPKALFATHYHELTELAARHEGLENVHITVREHGQEVVFLHRVEPGPSDRSYGIHVARLAGLPDAVITRAWEILEEISGEHLADKLGRDRDGVRQLSLFESPAGEPEPSPEEAQALAALRECDPDDLSPRQAHELLYRLIGLLGGQSSTTR
ncbi:MAG: DNA mismatch repair protein MutS [Acidobacteriota bacterium]|nr:DNA mismatch repair protein MutS [Acidobacteriota bacterium]MDQ7088411.1 DNA mismatch repair protein MutS [Acidobacteriota bacterium]